MKNQQGKLRSIRPIKTSSLPIAMTLVGLLVLSMALVGGTVAADLGKVKPLTPDVAPASEEGAQAMTSFRIPAGWKIDLFAAEPDVANIVAFDIDHRGRVFVCESFRQNRGVTDNRAHNETWQLADLASKTVQDRIDYHLRLLGEAAITFAQHDDRIRRVTDTNGDGVADDSVVLANGFNSIEEGTGAGVLVRGDSAYYTCIPKLWKLIDANDDGEADERVVLADGFGVRVAFRGHDMHGLIIGPDGRLYFSIGDRGYSVTAGDRVLADPASGAVFRCELDGSNLEVYATGLRNPQELAFNDLGDFFSVDNNSDRGDQARIVHLLEGGDTGWRMYYQYPPDRGPFGREQIWKPFHDQQPAHIVPPVANFTDGPSGLVFYPGTGFGDQLKNKFLICDFTGGPANSGIRTFQVQPNGAFYQLADTDQLIWNCLITDVAFGPQGHLLVSDWVNGWNGEGKGRIYRLHDPSHVESEIVKEVASILQSDWSDRAIEDLANDLQHVDRRVRLEAQWQLAQRAEHPTLLDVARDNQRSEIARRHAVWGLEQIARHDANQAPAILASLRPLLEDSNASIRAAVAKVLGERGDVESASKLRALLQDDSSRVQYFAAIALGNLKDAGARDAVVNLLAVNNNLDPALRHAGIMYLTLAAKNSDIASLRTHTSVAVRRAAVVALRRLQAGEVFLFLEDKEPLVVIEAARAIHDAPIAVGMSKLAALIEGDLTEVKFKAAEPSDEITKESFIAPLTRRVLNANFRLGTPQSANALAKFATRISAPVEMRIEALDMLANWATPDPRDRVLNDYRPLKPRPANAAASALDAQIELLSKTEEVVREKMIDTASVLGLKRIVPMLAKRVDNTELPPKLRAGALLALARLDQAMAVKMAKQVGLVPTSDLVTAALEVLSRHDKPGSLDTFIQATSSNATEIRQKAWDILAASDHPQANKLIQQAVGDYIRGELTADVQLNVLQAAAGKLDEELRDQLAKYQAELAETDKLAAWLPSLEGGSVAKGETLFFEKTELSCVRCHKVDRAGGEVGPVLTTIGKQRDRRYLLESICLPDAQIAKGFESVLIADADGDVITGIVKTETDEFIEIILADGRQQRIEQDAIEARRRAQSAMPADLIKQMDARELRDLVAYLSSLKVDPRAKDDVE